MDRSPTKTAYYPVRCPGCDGVVNLLVGNSLTVTVQIHNVPACTTTFYYRCWLERGLRLPRVEFLAAANAMEMMVQPHGDAPDPTPNDPPPPPPRSPHLDVSTRVPSAEATNRGRSRAASASPSR